MKEKAFTVKVEGFPTHVVYGPSAGKVRADAFRTLNHIGYKVTFGEIKVVRNPGADREREGAG